MTNAALVHMMMPYDVNFQRFPPAHSKIKSPLTSHLRPHHWQSTGKRLLFVPEGREEIMTPMTAVVAAEDATDIAGNGECTHLHITCYGNGKICQRCVE